MKSATLYVESKTARDCATAAQLLGLPSGDDFAEATLRKALDAIPAIVELQRTIGAAVKKARAEWEATNPVLPSPGQQAARAIEDARR